MLEFDYIAIDTDGNEVRGRVAAYSEEAARASLVERGLTVKHVTAISDQPKFSSASRLSRRDAENLTQIVAELVETNASISEGFRAAACEANSSRLAHTLNVLASQLDAGRTLTDALDDPHLPAHVRGLVASAARTGKLGFALTDMIEGQQANRDLKWGVLTDLSYSAAVFCFAGVVFLGLGLYVVPVFAEMFAEFSLELPVITLIVLVVSKWCGWLTVVLGPILFVILVSLRVMIGDAFWSRLIQWIPLLGAIWRWSAISEFTRLCGVLLRYEVPLPDAIRLTSASVQDGRIQVMGRMLASAVESGQSLSEAVQRNPYVPALVVPFARWGEESRSLGDALLSLAGTYEERVRVRSALLRAIVPPIVLILILVGVVVVVAALISPLVSMVSQLSG